jgi:hypothetical protein
VNVEELVMTLYSLGIHDIDCYAFREAPHLTKSQKLHQAILPDMSGNSPSRFKRCPACGMLLNKWEESLHGLTVKKRRYDIGVTYDGVVVVSHKFKDVYDGAALTGLRFRQLPDDPMFFDIYPIRAVQFDSERRRTQFISQCDVCKIYREVVGANPVMLKSGTMIGEKEFVRTDLEFAGRDAKNPLFLCGEEAKHALSSAKLAMLDLEDDVTISD